MVTDLIIFLPLTLLTLLFRKTFSKSQLNLVSARVEKLKKNLHDENQGEKLKMSKSFKFPWWLKIGLFAISFTCMTLSIVFVIVIG